MKTSLRISCFTLIELVISMGILMAVTGIIAMAYLLINPPFNLWMLFLIGIPAQALVIFWFIYRKDK